MANTGDPIVLNTVFPREDVRIDVTVPGNNDDDPISGWTLYFLVWRPDGTAQSSGLGVTVTDTENRVVTATMTGLTFALGRWEWEVGRSDSGHRTNIAWGYMPVKENRPSAG